MVKLADKGHVNNSIKDMKTPGVSRVNDKNRYKKEGQLAGHFLFEKVFN